MECEVRTGDKRDEIWSEYFYSTSSSVRIPRSILHISQRADRIPVSVLSGMLMTNTIKAAS